MDEETFFGQEQLKTDTVKFLLPLVSVLKISFFYSFFFLQNKSKPESHIALLFWHIFKEDELLVSFFFPNPSAPQLHSVTFCMVLLLLYKYQISGTMWNSNLILGGLL